MTEFPQDFETFLAEQTEEKIRERLFNTLPDDLDKTEGSYIWDSLTPVAIELNIAALWAKELLDNGFASTAASQIKGFNKEYLDLRAEEHGIFRRPAVKAFKQNGIKFTGINGVVIPCGTMVATMADSVTNTSAIQFVTKNETVIENGAAYADIEAMEPGTTGNVPAGWICSLIDVIAGVNGAVNEEPIGGGLDIEDDQTFLARFLQRVRYPGSSGNKADYVNWTLEVPGVGDVAVIPVRDGPGTVSISIINADKEPANQDLVDKVLDYIAPPWVTTIEAETMTQAGYGMTVDQTQSDDLQNSIKMEYDSSGNGVLSERIESLLMKPGIWQAKFRIKADLVTGSANLLQIGVYNVSSGEWCKTSINGISDALGELKGNELNTSFTEKIINFYWDGQAHTELRITRLTSDITTKVWLDLIGLRSTFSKDIGEAKAPVGAAVTVEAAKAVTINITATLTIANGYNEETVRTEATVKIHEYIKSLAFQADNDVRYVRIGQNILDTPGVTDYDPTSLLLNGIKNNIIINEQEVAVLGTVNFS